MTLLGQLKKLSAEIGVMDLKRAIGQYVSILELDKKKKEFRKLSVKYRKQRLGY